jgi:hypothetical protein
VSPPHQPGPALRALVRSAGFATVATGLAVGALVLGPGLAPGYLLSYDMVFVPRPSFNAAMFGLGGTLPRAVPSDAVVAVLARAMPADLVQKLILLGIFVLAVAGVAALLDSEHPVGRIAAGVCYAWNPYVAERLIIGQWALLLGYAGLPWALRSATAPAGSRWRWTGRLAAALVPAAIGGFEAMCISALVVVPAAALAPGRTGRQRAEACGLALGVLAVLSLPWLIPALAASVPSSGAGVSAFAARADTPFGAVGSLLLLGGIWNAQVTPNGYGGVESVFWLVLVIAAIGCFAVRGRRRWPGLVIAAGAGFILASLGVTGPGRELLRSLIGFWPGFAVLRDGQQFVAPLALVVAAGLGLGVSRLIGWLATQQRWPSARELVGLVAAVALIAPVVLLPGLAWGAQGRLRPVQYPADWLAARAIMNSSAVSGTALLLPWAAYRRFDWNNGEAMLDPWPRLLGRAVIWNDGVQVGNVTIGQESPSARALNRVIETRGALTGPLLAAGIRYVIVDAGFAQSPPGRAAPGRAGRSAASGPENGRGLPYRDRLPGSRIVLSGPGLVIYELPAPGSG